MNADSVQKLSIVTHTIFVFMSPAQSMLLGSVCLFFLQPTLLGRVTFFFDLFLDDSIGGDFRSGIKKTRIEKLKRRLNWTRRVTMITKKKKEPAFGRIK
jgi:hypothetical protein